MPKACSSWQIWNVTLPANLSQRRSANERVRRMANPNKGLKPDMVSHLLRVAAPVEKVAGCRRKTLDCLAWSRWIEWTAGTSHNRGPKWHGLSLFAWRKRIWRRTNSFHILLIVMIRCLLQSSRSEIVRTWSDSRIQTQGNQVCVSILCQPCMSEAVRVKESPKSHLDCWIFAKSFWEESLEPSRIWVGCVDIFSLLSPSKSKPKQARIRLSRNLLLHSVRFFS